MQNLHHLIVKDIVHLVLSNEVQQSLEEGCLRHHRLDVEEIKLDEEKQALNEFDFAHTDSGAVSA